MPPARRGVNNEIRKIAAAVDEFRGTADASRMPKSKETKRVAAAFYHQTPNLWFPIEPHYGVPFFHWLPKPVRATLLARRKIGYGGLAPNFHAALETADHTEIITPALMRQLFPGAELLRERYYLFCKSIAVRGRS